MKLVFYFVVLLIDIRVGIDILRFLFVIFNDVCVASVDILLRLRTRGRYCRYFARDVLFAHVCTCSINWCLHTRDVYARGTMVMTSVKWFDLLMVVMMICSVVLMFTNGIQLLMMFCT